MDNNAVKWLWFQRLFGTGTRRAHEAFEYFGSTDELLSTPLSRIESDPFLTETEKSVIKSPDFAECEKIIAQAKDFGAAILTPDSAEYPESLRNIYSMPLVLYAVGDTSLLREHYLISMVGTRNPDEYGVAAAKKLSAEIALAGAVVVSGLAYGIDAVCHRAALEAGGKTIAFIAGGLDLDYPKRNRALRQLIEKPENGLVISEYPIGTQAFPSNFPMRNRLISGVSMATIVVQGEIRSGSMLTAAHALSQSRDLFAVPASILSPIGAGCNYLLSQGAEPAISGESIVNRYVDIYGYPLESPQNQQISLFAEEKPAEKPVQKQTAAKTVPDYLNAFQAAVLSRVFESDISVDELCAELSVSAGEMLTVLTELEIFGLVQTAAGRMVKSRI